MNVKPEAVSAVRNAEVGRGDVAEHGLKALDRSKDKLLSDLRAVVEDAQALMKEAVDTSAQGVAQMPAYFEDKVGAVKDHLQQVKSAVETRARDMGAATNQYVKDNPWKSIGFATAASLCISLLLVSASMASLWRTFGDKK